MVRWCVRCCRLRLCCNWAWALVPNPVMSLGMNELCELNLDASDGEICASIMRAAVLGIIIANDNYMQLGAPCGRAGNLLGDTMAYYSRIIATAAPQVCDHST